MYEQKLLSTLERGQLFQFIDKQDNRIYEFLSSPSPSGLYICSKYKIPKGDKVITLYQQRRVKLIF